MKPTTKPITPAAFAVLLLLLAGCSGPDVKPAPLRHLNPKVLGAPVSDSLDPLLAAEGGLMEPLTYGHRADSGRYVYFELIYAKEVGFEPARASLNQLYAEHEVPTPSREPMALWKNRPRQFTIKLTEEADGIRIQYDYIGPRGTQ